MDRAAHDAAEAALVMVAITTLRDAAGAEVARELLAEHGIAAEIRRLGYNAYFGSPTAEEFEVRVPADRVAEAHALLDEMADELARAAVAEAGVAADAARDDEDAPRPDTRRKLSWAIALSMLMPLAGAGCLYARAFRLGWILVGVTLAAWFAAFAGARDVFPLIGVVKLVDVVLAPIFAARFNRSLEEKHAASA